MPSWEVFEHHCREHPEYREEVLPAQVRARVSVEQASEFGWERYVGNSGRMIGMNTFGASAPLKELQTKFGFTPEHIVEAAKEQVRKAGELRKEASP
jgi:transketolase